MRCPNCQTDLLHRGETAPPRLMQLQNEDESLNAQGDGGDRRRPKYMTWVGVAWAIGFWLGWCSVSPGPSEV
jgi:hypothetical protein